MSARWRSKGASGKYTWVERPGRTFEKRDLLCVVDSQEDVLLLSGRFIQYYREKREVQGGARTPSSNGWA